MKASALICRPLLLPNILHIKRKQHEPNGKIIRQQTTNSNTPTAVPVNRFWFLSLMVEFYQINLIWNLQPLVVFTHHCRSILLTFDWKGADAARELQHVGIINFIETPSCVRWEWWELTGCSSAHQWWGFLIFGNGTFCNYAASVEKKNKIIRHHPIHSFVLLVAGGLLLPSSKRSAVVYTPSRKHRRCSHTHMFVSCCWHTWLGSCPSSRHAGQRVSEGPPFIIIIIGPRQLFLFPSGIGTHYDVGC